MSSSDQTSALFRPEAVATNTSRLHGQVILGQNTAIRRSFIALLVIIVAVGVWASTARYSRVEIVRGVLVTDIPAVRVTATRAGVLTALRVRNGQRVEKGESLTAIDTSAANFEGEDSLTANLAAVDTQIQLAKEQQSLLLSKGQVERSQIDAAMIGLNRQKLDIKEQIELQLQIVEAAEATKKRIAPAVASGLYR